MKEGYFLFLIENKYEYWGQIVSMCFEYVCVCSEYIKKYDDLEFKLIS